MNKLLFNTIISLSGISGITYLFLVMPYEKFLDFLLD